MAVIEATGPSTGQNVAANGRGSSLWTPPKGPGREPHSGADFQKLILGAVALDWVAEPLVPLRDNRTLRTELKQPETEIDPETGAEHRFFILNRECEREGPDVLLLLGAGTTMATHAGRVLANAVVQQVDRRIVVLASGEYDSSWPSSADHRRRRLEDRAASSARALRRFGLTNIDTIAGVCIGVPDGLVMAKELQVSSMLAIAPQGIGRPGQEHLLAEGPLATAANMFDIVKSYVTGGDNSDKTLADKLFRRSEMQRLRRLCVTMRTMRQLGAFSINLHDALPDDVMIVLVAGEQDKLVNLHSLHQAAWERDRVAPGKTALVPLPGIGHNHSLTPNQMAVMIRDVVQA